MSLRFIPSFHDGRKGGEIWGKPYSEIKHVPRSVPFDMAMLQWRITRGYKFSLASGAECGMYRNCIQALATLESFDAVFCLEADVGNEQLHLARRDQACIYLDDLPVAGFNEDSEGQPADLIREWPPLENPECAMEWLPERWTIFFLDQLLKEAAANLFVEGRHGPAFTRRIALQRKVVDIVRTRLAA